MADCMRVPLQVKNTNTPNNEIVCATKPSQTDKEMSQSPTDEMKESVHDVSYFRNILMEARMQLTSLCEGWESHLAAIPDNDANQTVMGDIRTVIGQAQLVMKERGKQFEELVTHCENQTGEKPIRCEDLQGFWDMIYFQVEDVNKKFEDLEKRRLNDWKEEIIVSPKVIKPKKKLPKKACGGISKEAQTKRLEARKRLAAAKAALREGASNGESRLTTFDAGFFKVESPLRTENGGVKSNASTPSKSAQKKPAKKPATPSSGSFLHGRLLRRNFDSKLAPHKPLDFGDDDEKTSDVVMTLTDADGAPVPLASSEPPSEDAAPRSLTQEENVVVETRSVATGTDRSCGVFAMSEALEKMSEQMEVIRDAQRSICASDESAQLRGLVANLQQENSKLRQESDDARAVQEDPYEPHYLRMRDKVLILEARLRAHGEYRSRLPRLHAKLRRGAELLSERTAAVERERKEAAARQRALEEAARCENKELEELRRTCSAREEELAALRSKCAEGEESERRAVALAQLRDADERELTRLREENEQLVRERDEARHQVTQLVRTFDEQRGRLDSMRSEQAFEREELVQEKLYLEDEMKMVKDQLMRSEEALRCTEEHMAKLHERANTQQSKVASLKESLDRARAEARILQAEVDMTKNTSRLAILQQQQDVISGEQRLHQLLQLMRGFHARLGDACTDDDHNDDDKDGSGEPGSISVKTPRQQPRSKSLVVSALLASSGDVIPSPTSDENGAAAQENLFLLVEEADELMKKIVKLCAAISEHHKESLLELQCDNRSLSEKIGSLKRQAEARDDVKHEVEAKLRRRLTHVIDERDQVTAKWRAREATVASLSERVAALVARNKSYEDILAANHLTDSVM